MRSGKRQQGDKQLSLYFRHAGNARYDLYSKNADLSYKSSPLISCTILFYHSFIHNVLSSRDDGICRLWKQRTRSSSDTEDRGTSATQAARKSLLWSPAHLSAAEPAATPISSVHSRLRESFRNSLLSCSTAYNHRAPGITENLLMKTSVAWRAICFLQLKAGAVNFSCDVKL